MYIGVIFAVVSCNRVDDSCRLLGGCGAIEVDQRMTIDGLVQRWKIVAVTAYVNYCVREWLAHGASS
jgi:hypothetical protein